MSKMRDLQTLIEAHGPCTIDSISHLIDGMTLAQAKGIAACLANDGRIVRTAGAITSGPERRGAIYARGRDRRPAVGSEFWKRQIPSVFHLADFT